MRYVFLSILTSYVFARGGFSPRFANSSITTSSTSSPSTKTSSTSSTSGLRSCPPSGVVLLLCSSFDIYLSPSGEADRDLQRRLPLHIKRVKVGFFAAHSQK